MHICFHEDIDTANSIQFYLLIFVVSPITHSRHVCSASIVLFIALRKDHVLIEAGRKSPALF